MGRLTNYNLRVIKKTEQCDSLTIETADARETGDAAIENGDVRTARPLALTVQTRRSIAYGASSRIKCGVRQAHAPPE
jgi:hypothetical protein